MPTLTDSDLSLALASRLMDLGYRSHDRLAIYEHVRYFGSVTCCPHCRECDRDAIEAVLPKSDEWGRDEWDEYVWSITDNVDIYQEPTLG